MRFYDQEDEEEKEQEQEHHQGTVTAVGLTAGPAAAARANSQWGPYERVLRMARANAVVVFSASGCCMCHVVKRLLLGLGVGPTIYEVDQLEDQKGGTEIQAVLSQLVAAGPEAAGLNGLPAVFVGGKLLGGVEKVMACHINGSLVPLLKQAGALWL